MRLWKKTVILMLATLLCSLELVGGLTVFFMGRRSLENAAGTYGRQMEIAAAMLEQFWDNGKYGRMTEVGKQSYLKFQFQQCCGQGFAFLKKKEVLVNLTGYEIVDIDALGLPEGAGTSDYRIQRLHGKYLMLQQTKVNVFENGSIFSVRDITEVLVEIQQLALWVLMINGGIFLLAGFFIYRMMRRTVRAMEELQEVAGKQEILLGALAHEMKTPLTSIIGYSDSLLHVNLKEEQKEQALMHINREGRRMEALSGKMLQMMGLYRNQAILMEEHQVEELIRRVEAVEAEKAEGQGIYFRTEYEDFSLKMDIELMESLLLNLIDNGIHASLPGDTIVLRATCRNGRKILQVADEGRGIPAEELHRVTEAFYMVDKSRSRKNGGAGLGLALCKKITKLHGGILEIESSEGKGTTVTVSFSLSGREIT